MDMINPDFRIHGKIYQGRDHMLDALEGEVDHKILSRVVDLVEEFLMDSEMVSTYTSGTTGQAKQINHRKEFIYNSCKATHKALGLRRGRIALLALPLDFIAGKMMVYRAFLMGYDLHISPPQTDQMVWPQKEIELLALVPLQVEKLLKSGSRIFEFTKNLIVGGAKLSNSLEHELLNRNCRVFETFGMTETITHVALREIGTNQFVSVDGVSFERFEDKLVINANHIGINKLVTNDIVDLLDAHSFKWKGRADNIINSGGVKIHPEEIEGVLEQHHGLTAIAYGAEDPSLGQKLEVLIESDDIALDLRLDLPQHLQPKAYHYLPEFERTQSGKIRRKETLQKAGIL